MFAAIYDTFGLREKPVVAWEREARRWMGNAQKRKRGRKEEENWTQTTVSNALDTTLKQADKGTTRKMEQEHRRRKRPSEAHASKLYVSSSRSDGHNKLLDTGSVVLCTII